MNKYEECVSRSLILELLSDDEMEAISFAETSASLEDGEVYIDLCRLDRGIQFARDGVRGSSVLPRRAVRAATWSAVVRVLNRSPARHRTGGP